MENPLKKKSYEKIEEMEKLDCKATILIHINMKKNWKGYFIPKHDSRKKYEFQFINC